MKKTILLIASLFAISAMAATEVKDAKEKDTTKERTEDRLRASPSAKSANAQAKLGDNAEVRKMLAENRELELANAKDASIEEKIEMLLASGSKAQEKFVKTITKSDFPAKRAIELLALIKQSYSEEQFIKLLKDNGVKDADKLTDCEA